MDEDRPLTTTTEYQTTLLLEHLEAIRRFVAASTILLLVIAVFLGIIAFGDGIQVEVVDL